MVDTPLSKNRVEHLLKKLLTHSHVHTLPHETVSTLRTHQLILADRLLPSGLCGSGFSFFSQALETSGHAPHCDEPSVVDFHSPVSSMLGQVLPLYVKYLDNVLKKKIPLTDNSVVVSTVTQDSTVDIGTFISNIQTNKNCYQTIRTVLARTVSTFRAISVCLMSNTLTLQAKLTSMWSTTFSGTIQNSLNNRTTPGCCYGNRTGQRRLILISLSPFHTTV